MQGMSPLTGNYFARYMGARAPCMISTEWSTERKFARFLHGKASGNFAEMPPPRRTDGRRKSSEAS